MINLTFWEFGDHTNDEDASDNHVMILKRKENKKCNMLKKCAQLGIPITFTQFKLKIVVITQERLYSFLGIDYRVGVA
jgi:hypothetical protein